MAVGFRNRIWRSGSRKADGVERVSTRHTACVRHITRLLQGVLDGGGDLGAVKSTVLDEYLVGVHAGNDNSR